MPVGPCSRHQNDTEVQPVPRVSEECEVIDAEASGQHLDEGLKGIDPCEGVPGGERASQGQACHLNGGLCDNDRPSRKEGRGDEDEICTQGLRTLGK